MQAGQKNARKSARKQRSDIQISRCQWFRARVCVPHLAPFWDSGIPLAPTMGEGGQLWGSLVKKIKPSAPSAQERNSCGRGQVPIMGGGGLWEQIFGEAENTAVPSA